MARAQTDIWSNPKAFRQQVRLAAVQVAALSEEELPQALAYEVEPFSKIPASEAEVAWRELPETDAAVKAYEVAVVRAKGAGAKGAARAEARMLPLWIFAALVAAGVACDGGLLAWRRNTLERAVAEQKPLDAQIRRLERQTLDNRAEAAAERESRERMRAAQDRLESMRSAYPMLMDAVAGVCGGRTVVREFSSDGRYSVSLRAVAVSAPVCGEVVADLTRAAAERGWRLVPGGIETSAQGTTAEFSCRLERAAGDAHEKGGE